MLFSSILAVPTFLTLLFSSAQAAAISKPSVTTVSRDSYINFFDPNVTHANYMLLNGKILTLSDGWNWTRAGSSSALAKRENGDWQDEIPKRCKGSTYVPKTTPGSPLINDCLYMANYLAKMSALRAEDDTIPFVRDWHLDFHDAKPYKRLFTMQSCVFGIYTHSYLDVWIGVEDIVEVIMESDRMFTNGVLGRLGAEGKLTCQRRRWGDVFDMTGTAGHGAMYWAIFNSDM